MSYFLFLAYEDSLTTFNKELLSSSLSLCRTSFGFNGLISSNLSDATSSTKSTSSLSREWIVMKTKAKGGAPGILVLVDMVSFTTSLTNLSPLDLDCSIIS